MTDKPLRILLTNDDGIHAPGLKVLENIARQLTDDIWIVAPETEQSGASHSLTMNRPLKLRKLNDNKYTVNGTPSDCVLMACHEILRDHRPDLVLSGVNYGANIAEDISYSGTVSAASEAAMLNIPAIALSLKVTKEIPKWATAQHYAPDIIRKLLEVEWERKVLINVNFPDAIVDSVTGVKLAKQGLREWQQRLTPTFDPFGGRLHWIHYKNDKSTVQDGTDIAAIRDNAITITPLKLTRNDPGMFEKMAKMFPQA